MTDPIVRVREAMARAAQDAPFDPIAVSLATSTPDGRPSCRVVLFHEIDERGLVFHTNYGGRKAVEIEANPWAAICAYWPWTDEQIRVEGQISRCPRPSRTATSRCARGAASSVPGRRSRASRSSPARRSSRG